MPKKRVIIMKLTSKTLTAQAKDAIMEMINNSLDVMTKLPSENELSTKLGVSRNTVREALKTLENDGVVSTRHGVGTFVIRNSNNIISNITILDSFTKIITSHGYTPGSLSNYVDIRPSSDEIASKLGVNPGDDILYIERIRTADGIPVIYVEDYLVYKEGMYEEYTKVQTQSLFDFWSKYSIKMAFSNCNIKAVISDVNLMKSLKLNAPRAMLYLQQTHYCTKGVPVMYSDSYFISDKFDFSLIRKVMD